MRRSKAPHPPQPSSSSHGDKTPLNKPYSSVFFHCRGTSPPSPLLSSDALRSCHCASLLFVCSRGPPTYLPQTAVRLTVIIMCALSLLFRDVPILCFMSSHGRYSFFFFERSYTFFDQSYPFLFLAPSPLDAFCMTSPHRGRHNRYCFCEVTKFRPFSVVTCATKRVVMVRLPLLVYSSLQSN